MKKIIYSTALLAVLVLAGCSPSSFSAANHSLAAEPAIALRTASQQLLEQLPPPDSPILVSVYSFADQTGQHKPDELPQYSRAVTQGGLAFLKKALWDAGEQRWFRVLERGGLNHLLKEREIVRTVRAQFRSPEGRELPGLGPLLYAGMLLEGGIIAYESNEITGGMGARYLGIGGASEYRRDVVTVSLRAVSVTTGEVVAAVTTSKTIFSMGLNGGVFKYVSFDELLEGEAGFTMNEPPQLAVRQATELAVYSLVMKGYEKRLWEFADSAAGQRAYAEYLERFQQPARPPARRHAGTARPSAAASLPAKPRRNKHVRSDAGEEERSFSDVAPVKTARLGLCHPELPTSSGELSEGYYFQVASLKPEHSEANVIHKTFLSEGLPISLEKAYVSGSTYCRILVGPYASLSAARQEQTRISQVAAACISRDSRPFIRQIK